MDSIWQCDGCRVRLQAVSAEELVCANCGRRFVRNAAGYWPFTAGFTPSGFAPSRREHLSGIESEHFWFPARRRLLASLVAAYVPRGGAAIDLGCGSGAFLPVLAKTFDEVVGVDAYAESLATARQRCPAAVLVQADVTSVPLADAQFELVVALDVLEHVAAAAFLNEASRLASPTARLLLSVPAFPSLWSPLDEAAGHRCRYRLASLAEQLAAGGWRIVHHTHYQALLFPLVWCVRRCSSPRLRRAERAPVAVVSAVLAAVNRLEVALFSRFRLPWGSSLVVVARRTRDAIP